MKTDRFAKDECEGTPSTSMYTAPPELEEEQFVKEVVESMERRLCSERVSEIAPPLPEDAVQ